MRIRIAALVLASGIVLAACGDDERSSPAGQGAGAAPTTDTELLAFDASTVDGSSVDVGALAGTDVAIWFWAPW